MSQSISYSAGRTRLLRGLSVATAISFVILVGLALFFAETEKSQGAVQRVIYMHVGSFFGGATLFAITVFAGIQYLRTRDLKWDRLALCGVEIGLPLVLVTLVTGIFWSRPIWNTWWAGGDPRLNSMAVMCLLYGAYLTLRNAYDDPERRARHAAIYGLLAFISVFYTFIVIRIRPDTLHPTVVGGGVSVAAVESSFRLTARMGITLALANVWWVVAALTLLWHRVRLENVAERVRRLKSVVMGA